MIQQDDAHARRVVEQRLGIRIYEPFAGLLLLDSTERLYGAVIVNCWDGHDCQLTIVSAGPWTVKDARDLARYVFVNLGCIRASCETLTANVHVILILQKLGFRVEGYKRMGQPAGDTTMFGLLRSEQRLVKFHS